MNDYIKREDALKSICYDCNTRVDCKRNPCVDYARLRDIPAADVRENVHGKWEEVEVEYANDIKDYPSLVTMRCGKCKKYHTTLFFYGNPIEYMNFCPICGAIMDEEAEK